MTAKKPFDHRIFYLFFRIATMVVLVFILSNQVHPTVVNAQELIPLLEETFEKNDLDGWRIESDAEGNFRAEDGHLVGNGPVSAIYDKVDWGSGTFALEFDLLALEFGSGININLQHSNMGCYSVGIEYIDENYLYLELTRILWDVQGQTLADNRGQLFEYLPGRTYHVSVYFGDGNLNLYIIKQGQVGEYAGFLPILTAQDENPLPPGGIAFEFHKGSYSILDNLLVLGPPEMALRPEELPLDIPKFPDCIDQELLYAEDFEDSNAKGWDLEGGWRVADGMLMGEGHYFANYAQERWEDLTLYVTFMLPSGLEGLHINIRVSDVGRYFLALNSSSIGLEKQLGWGTGEQFIPMDHQQVPIHYDKFHTVGFSAHQGLLEVSLDGVQQIMTLDEDFLPAGGISFETLDDTALIESLWVCATIPGTPGEEQPPDSPDTAEPIELPDLQIREFYYSDFDQDALILPLTITVSNSGDSPAGITWLHVQQHDGVAVEASQSIGALHPGESRHIQVNLEIPTELLGRTVRFDISLDPENHVREHNENNNNRVSDPIHLSSVSSEIDWRDLIIPAGVLLGITVVILVARAIHRRRAHSKKVQRKQSTPGPIVAPPLRLLNLWVTDGPKGKGARIRANQPLISGHTYTLHAQVMSNIKKPKRRPRAAVDQSALSYDLVVFSPESDFLLNEGHKEVQNVSSGSSEGVTWSFQANQAGTRRVRVCLFFGNLLLQSAYIDAQVVEDKKHRTKKRRVTSELLSGMLDYVANATLTGFENDPQPSLTILTNQDANGEDWIAVYADGDDLAGTKGGKPRLINPIYLNSRSKVIRDRLWDIMQNSQYRVGQHPKTSRTQLLEQLEKDLAHLAREGWATFDDLFMHEVTPEMKRKYEQKLRPPGLVSVNRCRGDKTTLPWAAIYDLYVDAADISRLKLCPIFKAELAEHWSEALTDFREHADWLDNPQGCRENPNCPLKKSDVRQFTICPFGFWGFRHQISQPHQLVKPASHGQIPQAIARSIRDGNSTRFDQTIFLKRDKNQMLKVALGVHPGINHAGQWLAAFQSLLPGGVEPLVSTDRDEIKHMLEKGGFHIYLLYCHGEVDKASRRFKLLFDQRSLSWDNLDPYAQWPLQPKPLVILNACETVSTTPEVLFRMLDGLHELGASGVVGTEIKVSPSLAYEFILAAMKRFVVDGASIGEAFLAERKTLLRHFSPLGLVYSYYAPAALHLHQEGRCIWCAAHGIQDAGDAGD